MILFLLKNGRLRVNLLVALLLVFGTVPEGSEGLQCNTCSYDYDGCKVARECNGGEECLLTQTKGIGSKHWQISGRCIPKKGADCIKQHKHNTCVRADGSGIQFSEYNNKMDECFPAGAIDSPIFNVCVCDTDRCNSNLSSCGCKDSSAATTSMTRGRRLLAPIPYLIVLLKFLYSI